MDRACRGHRSAYKVLIGKYKGKKYLDVYVEYNIKIYLKELINFA